MKEVETKQIESSIKKLEEEEKQLVNKLQHTYQNERKMVQNLYKTNAQSPVKPLDPKAEVKDFFFK